MRLENAILEWKKIIGDSQVFDKETAEVEYGSCTTGVSRAISASIKPLDASHIPNIVKIANKYKVALYPISTGHNWGYGTALPSIDNCVILDLSALNKILEFDPDTGLVTLEPGVTQGQLAEFLTLGNHSYMVPVTGAGPTCSLLGNALERGYGITPITDHFGAVISIEAVLADGSIYQSALSAMGGESIDRAFKWNVGPYLDGIFSQGSFGVVTKMTIALAHRPESVESFLFGLKNSEQLPDLVRLIQKIITRYPGILGGVNLMNAHRVLAMSIPYPRDKLALNKTIAQETLSELCKANHVMPWTGLGTLYGSRKVLKVVKQEIKAMLSPIASQLIFVNSGLIKTSIKVINFFPNFIRTKFERKLMMLERSMQLVSGWPNQTALPLCYWLMNDSDVRQEVFLNPARDGCGLIWYSPLVLMKPDSVMQYINMVTSVMQKHGLEPLVTLTSVTNACFDSTVPLLFDRTSSQGQKSAENCYWELLETGKKLGFVPYRFGIHAMSWLTADETPYWQTVRKIKRSLDPDNIISPGRYV
ncbi:MAG TPA: FAD-binding oxidoreductase [Nitrosomonas sp.]|nr:FAD-binding oxidoreductase [Nitrosomonas sp.]HMW19869.1 FAD-binding oxidoreductase [Nitrosomonas sp.]HMW69932.1 FAD-binding oxidoreductase [Nitrosomonas sp.]HMY60616.1 FAD-binding oxidoreductase [Nitrosomonas sp.]HMY91243.1 FAD-binding oxidoreductase [Nitrosomonas sp.]